MWSRAQRLSRSDSLLLLACEAVAMDHGLGHCELCHCRSLQVGGNDFVEKGSLKSVAMVAFRSIIVVVAVVVLIVEESLEVKLLTIWTVGQAEVGRVREEKRRRKPITEEKA